MTNGSPVVQDVLAGCGLATDDYSVAGGRVVHIPQVMSIADGPPKSLVIKLLPDQMPENFTAHAPAIAYDLDVAEVRIVPIEPFLIQLELLP